MDVQRVEGDFKQQWDELASIDQIGEKKEDKYSSNVFFSSFLPSRFIIKQF